ncbi:matrixin family metalloprotease [Streptomyces sp. NPDC058622]|uniref:matrixin family metalloprotease n=1 Tax=Streptomyces sp. NPDC058622 TaxID=3346562 RepID=UPI003648BB53
MRNLLAGPAAFAAVLLLAPAPAHAAVPAPCIAKSGSDASETREDSSVDDGEIRWTASTKYRAEYNHANRAWSYPGARIRIAPDAATTVNDRNYEDFSDARSSAAGVWSRRPGPAATDLIRFNKARMDTYDPATRRMVAAHELGHALGLCHKSGSDTNAVKSVMWPDVAQYPDVPTDVDKANLKKLWG